MKLVATTTALVAALSLFGCATENDGEGGGFLAGLRPAKPSIETQRGIALLTLNPAIVEIINGALVSNPRGGDFLADPEITTETIRPPFPINGICEICDVVVLRDSRRPEELNLLDEGGQFLCTLWVDTNGEVVDENCR